MKSFRFNSEAECQAYLQERPALRKANPAFFKPIKEKQPKIIRQSKRQPNSTEKRFELEKLIPMKLTGEILCYQFEGITLRLANGLKYKPDYWTVNGNNETVFFEVKGGRPKQREAGIKALKMAASVYPVYRFYLARYAGGQWDVQEILP